MSNECTVLELKAWLEGIEEMQPKDWVPDKTQWKKIRNKIGTLADTQPIQYAGSQVGAGVVPHYNQAPVVPPLAAPPPPNMQAWGAPLVQAPNIPVSSWDMDDAVQLPQTQLPPGVVDAAGPNYNSPFF